MKYIKNKNGEIGIVLSEEKYKVETTIGTYYKAYRNFKIYGGNMDLNKLYRINRNDSNINNNLYKANIKLVDENRYLREDKLMLENRIKTVIDLINSVNGSLGERHKTILIKTLEGSNDI